MACRDLLLAAFPDAVSAWTPGELQNMIPMDLLLGTAKRDPHTAMRMMQQLLDTAEEHLQDEGAAEQLLGWDAHDLLINDDVLPLLVEELKWDNRLACQLFLSAYVGEPQEAILETCERLGETELKESLEGLLNGNPYFQEKK